MRKRTLKQVISFMLCVALMISGMMIPAYKSHAEETGIMYYDWDETTKQLVQKSISEENCTVVTADTTELVGVEGGSWYIVKDDIEVEERIKVTGEVHLILANGSNLKAKSGIRVDNSDIEQNGLTIYAQSLEKEYMGILDADGNISSNGINNPSAIGSDDGLTAGNITINGGNIDASCQRGAAIGGGYNGNGGIITINGGYINAYSSQGAAIGGGWNELSNDEGVHGDGGTITINGGTIFAKSGSYGAAIGGGCNGDGKNITINGGDINVNSSLGAGIGGGNNGDSGNIVINGGEIEISSGIPDGAGIGGGANGDANSITINGGDIIFFNYANRGAGIGGGMNGNGGDIIINGGNIDVESIKGSGIGGGAYGTVNSIVISDGNISAKSSEGSGIGGGDVGSGGNITIEGGVIEAKSYSGAGIGSGLSGDSNVSIIIKGGIIVAESNNAAGIGGGTDGQNNGFISVEGGTIISKGMSGAGIGNAYGSKKISVSVVGGNIIANSEYGDRIGNGQHVFVENSDLYDKFRTITLCGMTEQTAIDATEGFGTYGVKDVYTLDTNKLYFYLPDAPGMSSVTADDKVYIGNINDDDMEATFHNCTYTTDEANNTVTVACTTDNCISYTIPVSAMEVTCDKKVVKNIELPENWKWSSDDETKTLTGGKDITATAVYVGEASEEQLQTQVEITLTCNHTGDTEVLNEKEATYDSEGYTGDICCIGCGEVLTKGEVTEQLTKPSDDADKDDADKDTDVDVTYSTHVQSYGWQDAVENGAMSGTSGESKRLEGIVVSLDTDADLGIQYTTHCQSYGWLPWASNGDLSGTTGEAKRLEAIMIKLTGADADKYEVHYRVHAQSYGWLGWAKDGAPAGTAGYGKRLEGIQIVVVKKGETFDENMGKITSKYEEPFMAKEGESPVLIGTPTSNTKPVVPGADTPNVTYRTHVQSFGWQGWKYNGQMSGTSGLAKRLEGIEINLTNKDYEGGIAYCTHVQTYAWQGADLNDPTTWKQNGKMAGTEGEAKRLEAICIALTGEMAEHYDIYYRVHAQTYGWLDWASNGAPAGTAGYGKRLEGIQIVLVPKGSAAPAKNYGDITSTNTNSYIQK